MVVIQPISGGGNRTQTPLQSSGVIQPLSNSQSPVYKPGAFIQQQQVSQPQPKQTSAQKFISQAKPVAQGLFEKGKSIIKATPGFIRSIPEKAKETFKETKQKPEVFTRGLAATTSKTVSTLAKPIGLIQQGIASATGTAIPERWDISKQAKEFNKLVDWNAEPYKMEAPKAFMAGEIIGHIQKFGFEWMLARGTVGKAVEFTAAKLFAPKIAFLAPKIATIATGAGLGQLEYDKEVDGSRVDRLKTDVIVFGLFEASPILAKGLSIGTKKLVSSVFNSVSSKLKSGKQIEIATIETATQPAKEAIVKETGKNPQALLVDNVSKASDDELRTISEAQAKTRIPKAIAEQDLYFQSGEGEVRKLPQNLKEDFWRLDNEGAAKGKDWHITAGLTPEKIKNAKFTVGKEADQKLYDELKAKITPSPMNENIKLVEEAIASGDLAGAKALYKDLPKEGYMPSFESIKKGVGRIEEIESAQVVNEGVKAVKETYGQHQNLVQKMKTFLRANAEIKNKKTNELYREHIPEGKIYKNSPSSDEVATDLGMTENELMQKIQSELDIKKQIVPKAPKEIAVPREQLPVGEGKEKVSRLEARMKGVVGKATPEEIDQLGLTTYKTGQEPERLAKAAKYVLENPDDAMRVLKGEIPPPPGNQSNDIFVAMTQHPNLTQDLANKLATLKSTAMGQNIGILKNIDPNNPVAIASDIYKIKEAVFIKRYGGKTVKEVQDKIIEKGKIAIKPPPLNNWTKIIEASGVRC